MASLKLSFYVDKSWESKKLNFKVKASNFTDSKCLVPSFLGCGYVGGAFVVNPFCSLKHIRVSRLETEDLEISQLSLDGERVENFEGDLGNESLVSERLNLGGVSQKGKFNVWKRFRRVKRVANDSKYRSSFREKDRNHGMQEKPKVVFDEISEENVIDSQNGVDFDAGNIGSDSSFERCNAILKQLESGDDGKALSFFRWMQKNGKLKQNIAAYNLILRVLGRRGDWDGAEAMVKEMSLESGCELTYQVFNTLIYACYKKGLVELGAKWFHMMLENGVQPNIATFGMLMALYQKGWNVEEAEFTFSKMRSLKIMCQSAYSAMLTIYTRMRLYDKAEKIIGFLREDEIVLNFENWLVLLNAYCQQGKLVEAEKVLASMKQSGFSPNIVAYNTLITGYGKISNMRAAQRLFGGLKRVGVEPDETTYRSMIEGWGRADNYEEARRYYVELKRIGHKPNSSNLYTMLNLQVKHGDEENVVRTLEEMMHSGSEKSTVLGILLQAYEKLECVHKVPLILRGSLYDHVLKNQISCSSLVMAYVENSMIDDALTVLREKRWEDALFEDNLYHLLICSCKDFEYPENAVKVFTCMPKSYKPNLHIICTMIDIYSTINDFAEAEKLYLMLKNSDVKLDMITFSVVVRMYVKSGALEEACSVLDAMEKQKNIVPDTYLLRDMLRIYQRCDKQVKLADLYYKLVKRGVIWDQEMYSCVINCCARALPVDELSRLFDEMLKHGFLPNTVTFNVMLDVYGKSRLFKRAREVFSMAKKRGLADVISYNTLIAAYGRSKDFKNMSSTVKKMHFNGFSVSLEAYNCMLDAYGKEGQMEKFRNILQRLKESGHSSDHYTYNIMINIYGEFGWIEEVANVLTELKESGIGPDLCSYNTLIKAYGIAGMVESAVDLVKEMRKNGIEPDRITYANLINALRKNDMFLEAVKWSLWMKQIGL
ncbi:pentatricopeptide repeat-containing protein At4g30825, chloroplastic [Nicotiana tomentosiformis]|uniref:pentatricopeptide repeat-containing protein At4g30825, chloroplastic n=1 Tax=Nicotiana tomentosiformis TaxID=4098 RepID=UPI00051C74C3|nr:pentatricopeptide repeat-containing protein At4g30825, chloroplastic [Nicotiana tomentosiformis]XP_018628491.1 pentatricopeptide repeat-containing protein At4g30825, chloroplastic [Nicotiana tomentosiformis]